MSEIKDLGSRDAIQDLDLLAAAWCLSETEVETLLRVGAGTLAAWRNSEPAVWNADLAAQIEALRRLQDAIWLHQSPPNYARFWRRPWSAESPIGPMTPLDAILEGGAPAVALITAFLISGACS